MRIMTNPNRGRGGISGDSRTNGEVHETEHVDINGAIFGMLGMQVVDPSIQGSQGQSRQSHQVNNRARSSYRGAAQSRGRGTSHPSTSFVQTQAPQHTFGPPRGYQHRGRGHFDHRGRPRGAPRGRGRGTPDSGIALAIHSSRPMLN